MNRRRIWLLFLLLVGTVCMLSVIIYSKLNVSNNASKPAFSKIPDDVERLIEKYTYRENDNGLNIQISGDRIVYRGKKIMGLRSNVVKATYFETIRGVLRSKNGLVEFSAADADWELNPTSPLILSRDVSVSFNNKKIDGVTQARIYLRQGVLEVTGGQKKVFHFR